MTVHFLTQKIIFFGIGKITASDKNLHFKKLKFDSVD